MPVESILAAHPLSYAPNLEILNDTYGMFFIFFRTSCQKWVKGRAQCALLVSKSFVIKVLLPVRNRAAAIKRRDCERGVTVPCV